MEEIDFEISSPFIKTLVGLCDEFGVKEYLYPKTIYKNKHFIVFLPPIANGDVDSPDNIYIDDDFYSNYDSVDEDYDDEEDASSNIQGEYTLSYGFSHIHFEAGFGENAVVDAAKRTLQMVKDIIERKFIGFHLKTEYGLEVAGYTLNQEDSALKEEFIARCKKYTAYSEAEENEKKSGACVRVCYWNDENIKTIELN